MPEMKVLTLWQPWATLVAIGAKRIETRSWSTNYRGPLAIHAAVNRKGDKTCYLEPFYSTLKHWHYPSLQYLPRGRIIAVCELTSVQPVEDIRDALSPHQLALGDFADGHYAWLFEFVRRLPIEIPVKGHQGLWTWDYSSETEATQYIIEHGEAQEQPSYNQV